MPPSEKKYKIDFWLFSSKYKLANGKEKSKALSDYLNKEIYWYEIPGHLEYMLKKGWIMLKGKYEIPDKMPKFGMFDPKSFEARVNYINEGMFAFVSWEWVNPFVEWIGERKCLEVMAGRGILSYALREKGVDVVSTDDFSWAKEKDYCKQWNDTVTGVEALDAVDAVEKYGKDIDILIMCWPFMDDTAYEVIKKLNEVNSRAVVVYIGEGYGGCTASDSFFDNFEEIEDAEFDKVVDKYQAWPAIHDYPVLGKYREASLKKLNIFGN